MREEDELTYTRDDLENGIFFVLQAFEDHLSDADMAEVLRTVADTLS